MQAARGASLTGGETAVPADAGTPPGRFRLVLGIAAVALAVDVVTKVLAVRYLDDRDPVPLVGDLLQLTLVRNPGAAFSTGTSFTPVIATFACVALVVAVVLALRVRTTGWAWAFGMLLAGITGNLVDRIFREPGPFRGHVIDMFQLPNWPVFNVADICINIAAGLIIVQSLRGIPLGGRPATDPDPGAGPEEGPAEVRP